MVCENSSLSFDDQMTAASGGNHLLEPGFGRFSIAKVKRSYFSGSEKLTAGDMAVLDLIVTDATGGEATITDRIILNTALLWKITQLAKCIGEIEADAPDGETFTMPWMDLVGRNGFCVIGHRTWTDSMGQQRTANEVKRYVCGSEAEAAREALSI